MCYIFMRSVTASYYSWKSIPSILSTLENQTRGNPIDFKTSIHIARCGCAQSPKVWRFYNERDRKARGCLFPHFLDLQ